MTEEDVFANISDGDGDRDITEFVPKLSTEARETNYARWNDAVERTLNLSA